jgi:hypothetical protein
MLDINRHAPAHLSRQWIIDQARSKLTMHSPTNRIQIGIGIGICICINIHTQGRACRAAASQRAGQPAVSRGLMALQRHWH